MSATGAEIFLLVLNLKLGPLLPHKRLRFYAHGDHCFGADAYLRSSQVSARSSFLILNRNAHGERCVHPVFGCQCSQSLSVYIRVPVQRT